MAPVIIAALVFGGLGIGWRLGARLTAQLNEGLVPPSTWVPEVTFTGAVTLGRFFFNVPGTAALDLDWDYAVVRPNGPRWFHPVWIARRDVNLVVAGPWGSWTEGGIRFRSDNTRLGRIGFWPAGRGLTNGRNQALAALRDLGWPTEHP